MLCRPVIPTNAKMVPFLGPWVFYILTVGSQPTHHSVESSLAAFSTESQCFHFIILFSKCYIISIWPFWIWDGREKAKIIVKSNIYKFMPPKKIMVFWVHNPMISKFQHLMFSSSKMSGWYTQTCLVMLSPE